MAGKAPLSEIQNEWTVDDIEIAVRLILTEQAMQREAQAKVSKK